MAAAAVRIEQALGRVDVLVHVAGGFEMGEPVDGLTRASWDRMMNLNAWSFVAVTKAFVPQMLGDGAGKVVAVSAHAAVRGEALKALRGVNALTARRGLSAEVRSRGINVNSVARRSMGRRRTGSPCPMPLGMGVDGGGGADHRLAGFRRRAGRARPASSSAPERHVGQARVGGSRRARPTGDLLAVSASRGGPSSAAVDAAAAGSTASFMSSVDAAWRRASRVVDHTIASA
jgi:NAD(P)-dependent dehydrogenase (short-subunit alcohol dehydrogenase family)